MTSTASNSQLGQMSSKLWMSYKDNDQQPAPSGGRLTLYAFFSSKETSPSTARRMSSLLMSPSTAMGPTSSLMPAHQYLIPRIIKV